MLVFDDDDVIDGVFCVDDFAVWLALTIVGEGMEIFPVIGARHRVDAVDVGHWIGAPFHELVPSLMRAAVGVENFLVIRSRLAGGIV